MTTLGNKAYTEAFRDGMRAAMTLSRDQANAFAKAMTIFEGDAYLAGYYAERRRMREEEEDTCPSS
jgi:hypothetical protein